MPPFSLDAVAVAHRHPPLLLERHRVEFAWITHRGPAKEDRLALGALDDQLRLGQPRLVAELLRLLLAVDPEQGDAPVVGLLADEALDVDLRDVRHRLPVEPAGLERHRAHLGCSRPTYIAIEKGERHAKAEEIVKQAAFFGRRVHELVLQSEPEADLQPHLRAVAERMQAGDSELDRGIAELQQFAEDYRELERLIRPAGPSRRGGPGCGSSSTDLAPIGPQAIRENASA
jgi:hypothetical protein